MDRIASHLPNRYAPLRLNGDGLQNVYLTQVPASLAAVLVDLIGREARDLLDRVRDQPSDGSAPALGLFEWEEHELQRVSSDATLPETDRLAIVTARRGQGLFKQNVMRIERFCRITKVDRIEHLRASHCKPWRDASNEERLDGENGLLLTPNADHLFDRGFISFEDDGEVLVSPVAHRQSLERMGLAARTGLTVGEFTEGQRRYLAFHRENVFLESRFLR
jgi:putative restriction endonuclease